MSDGPAKLSSWGESEIRQLHVSKEKPYLRKPAFGGAGPEPESPFLILNSRLSTVLTTRGARMMLQSGYRPIEPPTIVFTEPALAVDR